MWVAALALATTAVGSSGCLAYKVVSAPVKLAATSVVVAGETAGAVVSSTGKLAVSGVNAVGNVGSSGIDAAAKLAQSGMVTFVDSSNGGVVRVPWRAGLTLSGAGAAARLDLAQRVVEIVRGGKLIYAATFGAGEPAGVASGDVVRVGVKRD